MQKELETTAKKKTNFNGNNKNRTYADCRYQRVLIDVASAC